MNTQFIFKEGCGNKSNSSKWKCAYNSMTGEYTAALFFSSYQGTWLSLYIINKDIWDKVGTFENDDYKSERLIKTGELALEREYTCHWGPPMPDKVKDPEYQTRFAWYLDKE